MLDLGLIERRAPTVKAWLKQYARVPRTVSDAGTTSPTPGPLAVTPELLRTIMPSVAPDRAAAFAKPLEEAMGQNGINPPKRAAAFLANVAFMTGDLKNLEEQLAPEASGGRVEFRGRGLIPVGGRAEYARIGKGIDEELERHPDLMQRPAVACKAAAYWWNKKGLNPLADADNFGGVVFGVSGNSSGLDSRYRYYERALKALSASR